MSLKDRLTKKTAAIVQANTDAAIVPNATVAVQTPGTKIHSDSKPRTGPGQMLAFRAYMQESSVKVQELEEKLNVFDGALLARKLDPTCIRPSKWANRHKSSFLNEEFIALRHEIEIAGGNIQPILVRHIPLSNEFEIVFGHRRHQACLELKIPVLAVIDELSDKQLFAAMDRENRARADLSPFEQGEMYRRALDEGLFPSLRVLCSEIGVDVGNASKAMAIARLPSDILSAFRSPTEIQYRWGVLLQKALANDPEAVLKIARDLAKEESKLPAKDVLSLLIGKVRKLSATAIDFTKDGKSLGHLNRSISGGVQLDLKSGVINDENFNKLKLFIESIINS